MNASLSEKFKIKNYIEQARLDPPVLGREGGQHGQQHRLHQDKGHHREAREADDTEGPVSSPSYRLARSAENKLEIILDYVGVNMAFCDDINSNNSNQELTTQYGCAICTQLFARRVFGRNKKW